MADDDNPSWLPPSAVQAPPEATRLALQAVWSQIELMNVALGSEVSRRFPDLAPYMAELESNESWQQKICAFLRRMEDRDRPERTLMNRMINEMEVFYDPPSPKHKLRVAGANGATRVRHDGWEYPFNSILPPEFARSAANFGAMMRSGRIRWSTDNSPSPKPVKIVAEPVKPSRPKVDILTVSLNELENWKATEKRLIELCGSAAMARDLLIADPAGNALYHKASYLFQQQQRQAGIPGGRVRHL
jgi:hypothetical protein